MYPKYLTHLARLGTANIHPRGSTATALLIDKLKLSNGLTVLDLGCGTGETIVRIASKYDVSIDGIDAIPEMLRIASRRIRSVIHSRRIKLYYNDFDSPLPFKDASYDRVYAESVLGFQNTSCIRFLLKEVNRILNNNGIFVMNEAIWKNSASKLTIEQINESCVRDFGLSQASEDAIYLEDWKKLFDESKFTLISFEEMERTDSDSAVNGHSRFNSYLFKSRLITFYLRAKGFMNSSTRKQIHEYKDKLKTHKNDGRYIENRLFVLKKC